jgi:hypothetical protein
MTIGNAVAAWVVAAAALFATRGPLYSADKAPAKSPEAKKEPPAEDAAARRTRMWDFAGLLVREQGHVIPEGHEVAWVPHILSDHRKKFIGVDTRPGEAEKRGDGTSQVYIFNGKRLDSYPRVENREYSIEFPIECVLQMRKPFIEAPSALWQMKLRGDWVVRQDAISRRDRLVADLESILNTDFHANVNVALREVERNVFIATGDYAYVPFDPKKPKPKTTKDDGRFKETFEIDEVDLFAVVGREPEHKGRAWGYEFNELLSVMSWYLGTPIVNEVSTPPTNLISITPMFSYPDLQPGEPQMILNNMTPQTGLVFRPGKRTIKVLSIEPRATAVEPAKR